MVKIKSKHPLVPELLALFAYVTPEEHEELVNASEEELPALQKKLAERLYALTKT